MLWQPLSDSFAVTREHLHQLAYFALSPARHSVEGRMGLRPTPGGFGTPEFGGRIARVEGALVVHEDGGNVATQPISTVRAAAAFFGNTYEEVWFEDFKDPLAPIDPDLPIEVDDEDSRLVGAWFEMGFAVFDLLRERSTAGDDASAAQIWPEHFDAAMETGSADAGERASYGFSPGDDEHTDPYIYVAAWGEIDRSNPYWNDAAFNGSSMSYDALAGSQDPAGEALAFFEKGYQILHSDI
ncbi:MAG: hypothetical protein WDZ96_07320 [Acidimicrobiia bacterium]